MILAMRRIAPSVFPGCRKRPAGTTNVADAVVAYGLHHRSVFQEDDEPLDAQLRVLLQEVQQHQLAAAFLRGRGP